MATDIMKSPFSQQLVQDLEQQLAQKGVGKVTDLLLPSTFQPSITDAVFLGSLEGEQVEVYISSANRYSGSSTLWRKLLHQPPTPGNSRFVGTAESVTAALRLLSEYLQQAGGEIVPDNQIPPPFRPADLVRGTGATPGAHTTGVGGPGQGRSIPSESPPAPSDLTDFGQVIEDINDEDTPVLLDADALFNELSRHVRGQEEALKTLSSRVARHIARREPRRPATFFAVGPTGVGKTTAAQSLVSALKRLHPSAAGYSYLRLDMSEYQESYRLSQLLGSPQGYVGYGEGSQLTDALVDNPRTVVVFDEIEKAHRSILRALMNAMDAGRLSTASKTEGGREINCRYAIFIFTSNHDSQAILSQLTEREAFGIPEVVNDVCRHKLVQGGVAPELVGRIGSFLVFQPLNKGTRAEIAALSIALVAEEYGLKVCNVDPVVVLNLLSRPQSNNFGARPIAYSAEDLLGDAFAEASVKRMREVSIKAGPPIVCVPWVDSFSADGGSSKARDA